MFSLRIAKWTRLSCPCNQWGRYTENKINEMIRIVKQPGRHSGHNSR